MIMGLSVDESWAQSKIRDWQKDGWLTDFSIHTVPLTDFVPGGPPRDGIASVDHPHFDHVQAAISIGPSEPVIVVRLDKKARAYPLRYLIWHEIVNDVFEGRPIAVTYCPLCNSSVVFDRRIDGEILEFGVSGLLRYSDMIMYDRSSHSWWQQFSGEGLVGAFAGYELTVLPSSVLSFSAFSQKFPDGQVLLPPDANTKVYGKNPYVNYDSRKRPFPVYDGDLPRQIPDMARVVVIRPDNTAPFAMELNHLRSLKRIVVDGVEASWSGGMSSSLDHRRIERGADVGMVIVTDEDTGKELVHDTTFAFVAMAFHPGMRVLTDEGWIELTAD